MKTLLIIDLQKQFKDTQGQYEKCLEYIAMHRRDYEKIIATLFVQDKSNLNYQKKLHWDGCQDANESDLEFDINGVTIVIKHGYGLPLGFASPDDEYDIIGCDADACVLATCFSLWDDGISFRVLPDYIYTTAEHYSKEDLLPLFERNFGAFEIPATKEPMLKRIIRRVKGYVWNTAQ